MKGWLGLVLSVLCGVAGATSVVPKPLAEMVRESDHVLVATVVQVDMLNRWGWQVADPGARTGPGSGNRIRLHLKIDEVLRSDAVAAPATLTVPLWQMWHYSLGSIRQQVVGTRGIFLLKGKDFQPTYHADFQRGLDERANVERLLRKPPLP